MVPKPKGRPKQPPASAATGRQTTLTSFLFRANVSKPVPVAEKPQREKRFYVNKKYGSNDVRKARLAGLCDYCRLQPCIMHSFEDHVINVGVHIGFWSFQERPAQELRDAVADYMRKRMISIVGGPDVYKRVLGHKYTIPPRSMEVHLRRWFPDCRNGPESQFGRIMVRPTKKMKEKMSQDPREEVFWK